MKHQPACLLLLWTLTAFVSCAEEKKEADKITATATANGIKLQCTESDRLIRSPNGEQTKILELPYKDEKTGEYMCVTDGSEDGEPKIFVKFRTCDNCVELDAASISGIVVGDVVATVVIGVAVYLIASQARIGPIGPIPSNKKSSDRQHLVPNEMPSRSTNSSSNDHYQRLKPKSGQKDTYDVLHRK